MSYVDVANLKGPQGRRGERGYQGLPGAEGIPTDEAVAILIEVPSQTRTAMIAKLEELMLNVFDYGAEGDGETDDTAAIQAALDAAHAAGGGTVVFPPRVYAVTNYLVLRQGVSIDGYGATVRRLDSTAYFKMFANGVLGDQTATGYSGHGDIHVRGLTVDLNSFDAPIVNGDGSTKIDGSMSAFDLGHGRDLSFTDVTIKNGQNGHYVQVAGCEKVLFDRCRFEDQNWLNPSNTAYEVLQVEPITQTSFPSFGAWDETPSRDVTVRECVFEDVVRGFGTHSFVAESDGTTVKVWCDDVRVERCTFRNIYDHGVSLIGYRGLRMRDCTISEAGAYGINIQNVQDLLIDSAIIQRPQKAGIFASGANGLRIRDTTIRDAAALYETNAESAYAAIRVTACTGVSVHDTTVAGVFHTYAYAEDTSSGTAIVNPRFQSGRSTANNQGWITSDTYNGLSLVGVDLTLFAGDASTIGTAAALLYDVRLFPQIVVFANNNGSDTASITSQAITKSQLIVSSAESRYRMQLSPEVSAQFGFPTGRQIRPDSITSGNEFHIRQVVGRG